MKCKIKIAYLMHIDWNWAKQRPHFICEHLSNIYDVDLFFVRKTLPFKKLAMNASNRLDKHKTTIIKKLPLSGKSALIKKIEKLINKDAIEKLFGDYDLIWITSPIMLQFIPLEKLPKSKIIYDCMDDYLSFPSNMHNIVKHTEFEQRLINTSNRIVVSSSVLEKRLVERYSLQSTIKPIHIINNAISEGWLEMYSSCISSKKTNDASIIYTIVYAGTVGEWVDFESINYVLERNPRVEFSFIGPSEIRTQEMAHPRINIYGPVSHEELPSLLQKADAFIMPFKRNELIEAVNPVKLYEYILFNRPTFALRYHETEKFSSYVELYSDREELNQLIQEYVNKQFQGDYSENSQQRMDFLSENTWKSRMNAINKIIEEEVRCL